MEDEAVKVTESIKDFKKTSIHEKPLVKAPIVKLFNNKDAVVDFLVKLSFENSTSLTYLVSAAADGGRTVELIGEPLGLYKGSE